MMEISLRPFDSRLHRQWYIVSGQWIRTTRSNDPVETSSIQTTCLRCVQSRWLRETHLCIEYTFWYHTSRPESCPKMPRQRACGEWMWNVFFSPEHRFLSLVLINHKIYTIYRQPDKFFWISTALILLRCDTGILLVSHADWNSFTRWCSPLIRICSLHFFERSASTTIRILQTEIYRRQ